MNRYEILHEGRFLTLNGDSEVGVVARLTNQTRHHFLKNENGVVVVWPHGQPEKKFSVRRIS